MENTEIPGMEQNKQLQDKFYKASSHHYHMNHQVIIIIHKLHQKLHQNDESCLFMTQLLQTI